MDENNNMMNNIPPRGAVPPPQNGMPYGQGTYGPMPYDPYNRYTSYVKPIKEPLVFKPHEKRYSLFIAALAYLFVQFVLWNVTGYFTTAFYFILLSAVMIFLRISGCKFSKSHKLWAFLMYAFSSVFSITANNMVKGLDVIFIHLGTAYLIYCVTHERKLFERFAVFEILKSSVADPLSHFDKEFSALGSNLKGTNSGKNIKSVLIGIMIAVPLTIVVAVLLASADAGVEHMFNSFFGMFNFNNGYKTCVKLLFSIPVAGYLFGLLYSQTHKDKTKQLTEEYCDKTCKDARKVPNTAMYTAVTPICILYVLFFISQINYFISAFRGILPEEYDYSQYARRGFFELFAIELINAGVIFFINFFSKKTGDEKPVTLKIYTIVISVFTLLITATAISKMVLYISNCGLTQLRVYTTWFMILTALMFIYVIIKQFRKNIPIIKYAAVSFVLMFGMLCFSRPDALIARYNLECASDKISGRDISIMADMSADSAAVLVEPKYEDLIRSIYGNGDKEYDDMCNKIEKDLDKTPYNEFNLSAALIRYRMR